MRSSPSVAPLSALSAVPSLALPAALALALVAACGDSDPSGTSDAPAGDAGPADLDGSVGSDAGIPTGDASAPDAGLPRCGMLDFEDALGSVALAGYLTGAKTEVIGGVSFTAAGTDGITNGGPEAVEVCPFTSDWLGLWSYGDGGTIHFPAPVAAVEFVGGAPSTTDPCTFEVHADGELIETFSIIGTEPTPVTILLFEPSDTLVFTGVGGPNTLVGMDDFRYVTGDCDP